MSRVPWILPYRYRDPISTDLSLDHSRLENRYTDVHVSLIACVVSSTPESGSPG